MANSPGDDFPNDIILGQEAICPHGLGRVVDYLNSFPEQWIRVLTYVNNRQCEWDYKNVELINPRGGKNGS